MHMQIPAILLLDGYKAGHYKQYPEDTTLVYSNLTARSSRTPQEEVVAFGFQYFVQEYLIDQFQKNFFDLDHMWIQRYYERRMKNYLGPDAVGTDHIMALHSLGYLPLKVKAVPEGTLVPIRVPMLTMYNTLPEFYWLTNMLETLMSNILWGAITSATTSHRYRVTFDMFASITGGDEEFVPWQAHDFSFRGLTGVENASLSGAAHLLSFTGTDTIPAIDLLEEYYGADSDNELVGGSIPATEHSVMCMGEKDNEFETFKRLITEVYPSGPVSIVSDTWDLWKVLTDYLPRLKKEIMARDGKIVIRPDSGDPELILCGDSESPHGEAARKGVLQLLWETFGGTEVTVLSIHKYKVLDSHVGAIYGEAITPERQHSILETMEEMGFASTNIVFGIGSYTFQYVTRDTYGMAIKSTYGETKSGGALPIFKDPITDSGLKKSAYGLLRVEEEHGVIYLTENVTWDEEKGGILQTIFEDGTPYNITTLAEIRERLANVR